jgi:hypothetical protein
LFLRVTQRVLSRDGRQTLEGYGVRKYSSEMGPAGRLATTGERDEVRRRPYYALA